MTHKVILNHPSVWIRFFIQTAHSLDLYVGPWGKIIFSSRSLSHLATYSRLASPTSIMGLDARSFSYAWPNHQQHQKTVKRIRGKKGPAVEEDGPHKLSSFLLRVKAQASWKRRENKEGNGQRIRISKRKGFLIASSQIFTVSHPF